MNQRAQLLTGEGPERGLTGSRPQILLARNRKLCSSCMKRKTYWLFVYAPFLKIRQCWNCMDRELFREEY